MKSYYSNVGTPTFHLCNIWRSEIHPLNLVLLQGRNQAAKELQGKVFPLRCNKHVSSLFILYFVLEHYMKGKCRT